MSDNKKDTRSKTTSDSGGNAPEEGLAARLEALSASGRLSGKQRKKASVKSRERKAEQKGEDQPEGFFGRIGSFISETWLDLKSGVKTKRFRRGGTAVVVTALFICLIILLNVAAVALTDRYTAFSADLTKNSIYTLSDTTTDMLRGLDRRVEIDILASEQACEHSSVDVDPYGHIPMAAELIKRYEQYTDNLRVEFIDLNTYPAFLDLIPEYRDSVGDYYIVVRSELRTRVTSFYEMLPSLTGSIGTDSTSIDLASSITEATLSSLIKTVTMDVTPTVAYTDALGGGDSAYYLLNSLENNGFNIIYSEHFAFGYEAIPEDTQMVVVAAPLYDINAAQLTQLSDFLYNGGNYGKTLLLLASPLMPEVPNLRALAEEWGITITRNAVYEGDSAHVNPGDPEDIFSVHYNTDADYIDDNVSTESTVVSGALELLVPRESFGNIAVNVLLATSANGYIGTPDGGVDKSQPGYRYIAAQASRYSETLEGETLRSDLIVMPVSICEDAYFNSAAYSNFTLMMNICNERCGITEQTLNIPAVSLTAVDFSVDSSTVTILSVLFGYIIPLGAALTGLIVYLRRRRL